MNRKAKNSDMHLSERSLTCNWRDHMNENVEKKRKIGNERIKTETKRDENGFALNKNGWRNNANSRFVGRTIILIRFSFIEPKQLTEMCTIVVLSFKFFAWTFLLFLRLISYVFHFTSSYSRELIYALNKQQNYRTKYVWNWNANVWTNAIVRRNDF